MPHCVHLLNCIILDGMLFQGLIMPKYSPDETLEEIEQKPKQACAGLREDLKQCLLDSDCVRKVPNQRSI